MNLLLVVVSLVFYWAEAAGLSCESNCFKVCQREIKGDETSCVDLCRDHCEFYQTVLSDDDEISCSLKCYDRSRRGHNRVEDCHAACQSKQIRATGQSQKVNIGVGCKGYGREFCYKKCRLHSHESISNCLCACCKCTFPPAQ